MTRESYLARLFFVAALICPAAGSAVLADPRPAGDYRARLDRVADGFQEEDGAARYGALMTLVHLAYEYRDWPSEIEHLIIRATADPDDDVAGLAERTLFHYSRRNDPRHPAEPESVRRKRYDREELEMVRAILDDPDASHLGAAHRLVHLASKHRVLPPEVRRLLEETRSDPDFDVANLVESFLAVRDDRPMDPALVRPGAAPPTPPALADYGLADPRQAMRHQDARFRLSALRTLKEYALGADRRDDPEVLEAFVKSLEDPDPRVSSYARFMLNGLAGDDDALRQVYRREAPRLLD